MPRLIDAKALAEELERLIEDLPGNARGALTGLMTAVHKVDAAPTVEPVPDPEPTLTVDAAALVKWLEERVEKHMAGLEDRVREGNHYGAILMECRGGEAKNLLQHVRNALGGVDAEFWMEPERPRIREARVWPLGNGNWQWVLYFATLVSESEFPTFAAAKADLDRYLEAIAKEGA